MITSKSNYRMEIAIEGRIVSSEAAHDIMVFAGTEYALEIEKHLGIEASRISLVWDTRHECEDCETELNLVSDELECAYCEQAMCLFCNCNSQSRPICEDCWEESKR